MNPLFPIGAGAIAALYAIRKVWSANKAGAWLFDRPASRFRPGQAAVFRLAWLERSEDPFLGGAENMACDDTGLDVSVESLLEMDLIIYSWERLESGEIVLVFLEVSSHEDLWHEPFLDYAVRKHAPRGPGGSAAAAGAVFVATLPTVAALMEARLLAPEQRRLSFVFNTARCGSTLMHRMLGKVGVVSFSEPFWATQLCMAAETTPAAACGTAAVATAAGGAPAAPAAAAAVVAASLSRDEIRELFQACVAMEIALSRRTFPAADTFSVNFKAFGYRLLDELTDAYPDARHVFMYRNPIEIAESLWSVFATAPWMKPRRWWWPLLRPFRRPAAPELLHHFFPPPLRSDALSEVSLAPFRLSREETSCLVLRWADTVLTWTQTLRAKPYLTTLTLRMEEFTSRDRAVVGEVLAFMLGPDRAGESVTDAAVSAFDSNSQAGTSWSRGGGGGGTPTVGAGAAASATKAFSLSDSDVAEMEAAVACVPELGSCAFIVPGSLGYATCGRSAVPPAC